MEISVVIPTHKRPELLRSTLSSVAAQSRLNLVREVVVSENGSDTRSRKVCDEFRQLPLRYVQRDPALDVLIHFETLVREATSPWVAWIADDDMWGRYHLEEAERCFNAIPTMAGYFGAYGCVTDESCRLIDGCGPCLISNVSRGEGPAGEFEVWTFERMVLECLLRLPLNPWGLVCRKPALLEAITEWRSCTGGWDSDRYFLCALAKQGTFVAGRQVSLFFRVHPDRATASWTRDMAAANRGSRATTLSIIDLAGQVGFDAKSAWIKAIHALSKTSRGAYLSVTRLMPGGLTAIREIWGEEAVPPEWRRSLVQTVKDFGRSVLPPMLWHGLGEVRRRVTKKPLNQIRVAVERKSDA